MIYSVWVPLLMPLLVAPVARRMAGLLAPRQAVRLLTAAALTLGCCSAGALGLLAAAGLLRLPPVAALGRLIHPVAGDGPVTAGAAVAAGAALAVCVTALVRTVVRQRAELRGARLEIGDGGELAVVRDAAPDAYALPGRPGRIVVTTGMLRALAPAEREALFAHERAHLAGRHHLFVAAAELAAVCHPALRGLRAPLGYALERCADEAAAGAVGDRSLAARAIGHAALAAHRAPTARPSVALAATAGPVPRRVAALLEHRSAGAAGRGWHGRAVSGVAAALLVCLSLSAGGAIDAATDLHGGIEAAQAGAGHHTGH
ncbi:M56 family metallopeptidase [Streptomyces sp. NBC_00859]|uniref:M56 family metallopeptidase n=1 Tax=Streptomyces sp. NBC_00859 TaxID=2903682 RepID=UPI00386AF691|nr:M56 family metallopeptidase [Streptomyces sp. NBC_00859]